MLQKTKAVALHCIKYSDTAVIATLYTETSGRASFLVPVSRSRKAVVKPVLFQPLALVEVDFADRPHSALGRVKDARLFHPFSTLCTHPHKMPIALFLAEFLYRAVREESENRPLFAYIVHSIEWLDACREGFSNFHLVFLMRLTRFLGIYPNADDYREGDCFDLLNACFTPLRPEAHPYCLEPGEAARLRQLLRMDYGTMRLFSMSRAERARCLEVILDYYRLHLPDFPELKSLDVLRALFD